MTTSLQRALALGIAAAAFAGCSKVGTATGDGGRHPYTRPHELRFAAAEDITGLNPMFATQTVVNNMTSMTMAYLIKTDAHGDPTVPELATVIPSKANGGISPDGKTITWKLRRGVVWADGAPFSADDVVFSTKMIQDPKSNVISRDGWDEIVSIGEPDKYTVVYHLKEPYAPFSSTYFSTASANPAIVPKHLLEHSKDVNNDPYNGLPVGIGPFKFSEWKRGDSVVMVPNPLYFRGKPKLQKITYLTVQDRNTVLELLRTHELDMWIPSTPHYLPDLHKIDGIAVSAPPNYYYDHIDFNTQHPDVSDPVVRRALRMAIDRKQLNDKVQYGGYDLGESVVPPASHFHKDIPLQPLDIVGANKLLDSGGWVRGADGIRAKNGVKLDLEWAAFAGSADADERIELIRNTWKQIGVAITVKHSLASVMFAPMQQGGILYGGKFDVTAFAWGNSPQEDLSNTFACYRFPPNGQNVTRYCNKAITAVIDQGKVEYDDKKRVAGMNYLQSKLLEDAPTIVLDTRKEIAGYNADLKNWHPNPVSPFDDMLDVDI